MSSEGRCTRMAELWLHAEGRGLLVTGHAWEVVGTCTGVSHELSAE